MSWLLHVPSVISEEHSGLDMTYKRLANFAQDEGNPAGEKIKTARDPARSTSFYRPMGKAQYHKGQAPYMLLESEDEFAHAYDHMGTSESHDM